ncbi:MAG: hypothetical protein JNK75_00280 [Betaproteobacteria bacterium]|nr:hypothetical protein [Betaproteobacteria bacterium]
MNRPLVFIKLAHTAIWVFFVACIAGIPIASSQGRFGVSALLAVIVLGEVLVLMFNAWRCPLTAVAAHHTEDRRPNFDIFLPEWLAKYNQEIFGTLYVAGCVLAVGQWWVA